MSRTTFFQRSSTGAPATGVVHAVTSRYDGNTAGPSITVVEVSPSNAPGFYYFDVSPTGNLLVGLDAGSGVSVDEYRYLAFSVLPDSSLATPTAIADAVWDEALSGHSTTGSAGKTLADAPAASAIADAVWDEALSGHSTTGSAGKALTDSAAATAAAIADAVWDEALSGHASTGTFGRMMALLVGLEGMNRRVISTTYTDGRPVSQIMAVYANSTDANADTNRLTTVTITRAFDALGRPTTSLQVGS